jgi:hypothetical protein
MSRAQVGAICGATLLCAVLACTARAADPVATDANAEVVSEQVKQQTQPAAEPPNQKTRQNLTAVAFWMLVGVVLMGVLLLMFVVILGYQTRRLARKRSPKSGPLDELWYLRPPKKPVSPANVSDAKESGPRESDSETE